MRAMTPKREEISLETLMRYREFMTPDQLERYSAYYNYKEIIDPFTHEEIQDLERKRQTHEGST